MDTDFYSHSGEFCHYSERNATIHWLFSNEKQGQVTREDGPTWHSVKTGTLQWGVVFLVASLITSLAMGLFFHQFTPSLLIILFILVLYGLLGYLDDFIKVFKTEHGLEFSSKLIGQIFGGLVFYFVYRSEGFSDTLDLFGVAEVPLGIFMACLLFLVSRFF